MLRGWVVEKNGWKFEYTTQTLNNISNDEVNSGIDKAHDYAKSKNFPLHTIIHGDSKYTNKDRAVAPRIVAEKTFKWNARSIRCPLPWEAVRITYNGDIFMCCWGQIPVGSLRENTLEEIWCSDVMKSIRRDMINGELSSYCSGAPCPFIQGATEFDALPNKKDISLGTEED